MEDGRPLKNRLFDRLPFVRRSLEEARPVPDENEPPPAPWPTSPTPVIKQRRRKGSLRKTLLTGGHFSSSSARHYHPDENRRAAPGPTEVPRDAPSTPVSSSTEDQTPSPRPKYGSTTDDDADADALLLPTLRPRGSSLSYAAAASSASAPANSGNGQAARRKPSRNALPPPAVATLATLAHPGGGPAAPSAATAAGGASTATAAPIEALAGRRAPPRHDYAETEWWGWIILATTWLVFVVGMGSCLGVWSWAWDVGETPYAPPELEDDPTLPIVGYYPALIVMTGVMAWVWVIVAWVGMKYFRHAKVWDGEEY
jgi:hypothetical protein